MNNTFEQLIESVSKQISKRSRFYNKKLNEFVRWTSSKSEMNGTSGNQIRHILSSALIELGIQNDKTTQILLGFYKDLREFDASSFISKVNIYSRGKYEHERILDLFNKNSTVVNASISALLSVFLEKGSKFGASSMSISNLAGLCIFSQCIFMGARSDRDGFGSADNLVALAKNIQRKRLNEIEKKNAQKNAIKNQDGRIKAYIRSLNKDDSEDEEDDIIITENTIDEPKLQSNSVDDWESLI